MNECEFQIISSTVEHRNMNAIREYINGLRGKYYGLSHIDLLCSKLKFREFDNNADWYRQRASIIIRKWMVASISQWLFGIPNEVMLTFVKPGETADIQKLCQFIIPKPLIDYSIFARNNDAGFMLKDTYIRHAFIIHDELFPLNDKLINTWRIDTWKMITSSPDILARPDGKVFTLKYKRIAVPLAFTNRNQENGGFMLRSFGYRRFGCIEIESIDSSYITAVDVDQMWAEAFMHYQIPESDETFDDNDAREFEKYNAKYRIQ